MKALLVRLSSIGDVVHTLPALAALHRAGWEVGWLVEPPSRVLLEENPLARAGRSRAPSRKAFGWARRARRARARCARARYDAALDFQGLWKSAAWARLSGAAASSAGSARCAPRAGLGAAAARDASRAAGARPRDRQEPRAAAARSASRRWGCASSRCRSRPRRWRASDAGLRARGADGLRGAQPGRRLGEQAVAGRALRRSWRASCAASACAPLVSLGPGRGGARRPRRRGLGRRGRALVPDDAARLRRARAARAARGGGRHGPAAPRLRGGHAGGGALRAHRPRAQRALLAADDVVVRRTPRLRALLQPQLRAPRRASWTAIPRRRGAAPPSSARLALARA